MQSLFKWEDGNGHAPGGGTASVSANGDWSLKLHLRPTIRGTADTEKAAMAAVEAAYIEHHVVPCWAKGSGDRVGNWCCPPSP